jgi:hypothetical protein
MILAQFTHSSTRTGGLLRRRINSDSSVQPGRLETYRLTFEEFLQAHGIEYKTGDEAAAEDFDRAIWEYHLWGRIPLWLKTVISCSAIGILYSVAVGSRHLSQYRYHPISRWKHPVPVQTSQILELVQVLPEIETLGIFGIVRKETDPILAAKVTGQWYKLYEWE